MSTTKKILTAQDFNNLASSNFVLEQKTTSEIEAIALTLDDTHKGRKIYDTELNQEFTWNGSVFNASPVELIKAVDDKVLLDIEAQIKLQNLGQPSVFSDGLAGSRVNSEKLMNFTNSNGGKINWYFFTPNTLKVSDITSLYFIINKKTARPPFIFLYTKPTGTGDLGGWYKSRITYELGADASNFGYAQYYVNEPSSNSLELKTIKLVRNFGNQDLFNANFEDEDVLYIGLGTDSGAINDTYNFDLQEFGYEVGSKRYSVEIQAENFDTALEDAGIEGNITVTNATGVQLQPKELVFIQKSEVAINNAAKFLINADTGLLDDAPKVGVVGGAIAVNDGSTFELIEKGKFSVIGIGAICDTGDEVWYRPFEAVEKWGTTAGEAGNAIRLGYALTDLGTNTNFLIDFNPQWASEVVFANSSNTDHKPVIDVNVVDSDTITRKGRYVVGVEAINEFLDKDNQIVDYDGSTFAFTIPTLGKKVQVVEGLNIGKIFAYTGTEWKENSKTTPIATENYDIQNDYKKNDLIVRNNKVYQANNNIPANTVFVIGTTGATWKKISHIPEWILTGEHETGDVVKRFGVMYEANDNIPANTTFVIGATGLTWKPLGTIGVAEFGSVYPTNGSTTSSATVIDLPGAILTLPSAGVYRVYYNISTNGSQDGGFALFSITDASNVVYSGSRGSSTKIYGGSNTSMATQEITIIATAPTTIKLRWNTSGSGTATLVNNTSLSSVFGFEKIGGYSPLISGEPVWTDGGEITIGATTTAPTKPTTRTADKIYYKQIGIKTWQVEGVISWASSTGANNGSGDYLITLPNNLSFDGSIQTQQLYSADIQTSTLRMFGKCIPNSNVKVLGSRIAYINGVVPYDATKFRIFIGVDSTQGFYCWGQNWLFLTGSNTEIRFSFTFQSAN